MTAFYFVWVLFILNSNFERNALAVPSLGCQSVAIAVLKNSFWTFNRDQKILQLILPTSNPNEVPQCFCDPAVGGLGDVTRIDLIDPITGILFSNQVCFGCPGEEVADAEVRFSLGILTVNIGPCAGIKVYRCRCTKSSSVSTASATSETIPTTATTSATIPTTTETIPTTTETIPTTTETIPTTTETIPTTTETVPTTATEDNYVCEYYEDSRNVYDCSVNNPCDDFEPPNPLIWERFPGDTGPSSYVQCSYDGSQCTNMNCTNYRRYIATNCTCGSY